VKVQAGGYRAVVSEMELGARVVPSGAQYELAYGVQRAVVVEVGAGLREYAVAGVPLVDGYAADEMCSGGRGQTMIPWPNRVDGGRYEHAGRELRLPLTEQDRGNAIHGLTRWLNWTAVEVGPDRVGLALRLHPQPGYPFTLDCRIDYALATEGLTVRTTVTNVGAEPAPYGTGAHPYLTVGTGTIDAATLTAPAGRWLPTDGRGIPTGVEDVAGTPFDLRSGRSLGGVEIDHSFTDLRRDADGRARVELAGAGRVVRLWLDEAYPYLQLFTGDTLAPDRRRRGLGVEPMTCAPNAFRTGAGLRVLAPGETARAGWGLQAS
jgi:aldose 1-epimerase